MIPYWSYHPSVWDPITAELERDHRVIRYDERGTGRSEPAGPYDLETAAADLEVVVEAAGAAPAVALCVMDGANRAVRVAARRPDLISMVVTAGAPPLAREALADSDSMLASNTVVGAFMQQLEADYRSAVRSVVEAANPQMSQDELRERVAVQVEHAPAAPASVRIREWAEDSEAEEPARELGDRLVIVLSQSLGGGWLPELGELRPVIAERFPDAPIIEVDDGMISRPDQTAAVIRERVTADLESPA